MSPQISRLVLLTIAIVAGYSVARSFMTPASFGQYGHYRGNALMEIADREPAHAGRQACEECHSELIALKAKGPHKDIGCESCHRAASVHANNPDNPVNKPVKLGDALCLRCHENNGSRPAWHKQIVLVKHYTGQGACIECHLPHQPNDAP